MKILVDLDVLTVAFWNRHKEALEFLARVKSGEFEVSTPYVLFDLVATWKYKELKDRIIHFYNLHSSRIITVENIYEESKKQNLDVEKLTKELLETGVKEEDAVLVVVTSLFSLGYLVTYNRKHLRDKVSVINRVLSKNGFREIKISSPSEF